MWFIGVEAEQETSAPPPKKNPGTAPAKPSETIANAETNVYKYLRRTYAVLFLLSNLSFHLILILLRLQFMCCMLPFFFLL